MKSKHTEIDPTTPEGQAAMEEIYQKRKKEIKEAMEQSLVDPDSEPNVLTTPTELSFKRNMKKLKDGKLDD